MDAPLIPGIVTRVNLKPPAPGVLYMVVAWNGFEWSVPSRCARPFDDLQYAQRAVDNLPSSNWSWPHIVEIRLPAKEAK